MSEPQAAKVGQTYSTKVINQRTSSFRLATMTVDTSCGGKAGRWHCIEHDVTFRNNLDKDAHLDYPPGTHTLAWICPDHGPEAP
jgi:hypothetical protein